MSSVTSNDIRCALKLRYPKESHALMFEVAPATGGGTRYADAVAFGLWASHGHAIEGIEIKVSRSDFLAEMKQPQKSEPVMRYCNRWWLAIPCGLVKAEELPPTWGLLELQSNGTLRASHKAPKLSPVAPTLGFVASMMRRQAGLDEEMTERVIGDRMNGWEKRMREQLDREYQNRHSMRLKTAEDAMAVIEKIKSETGIDLTSWEAKTELAAAIRTVMAMNGRYGEGLTSLHRMLGNLQKVIDESGLIAERANG